MEPTYSISYYLELQRHTLAWAGRQDYLLALSRAIAKAPGTAGKSEDKSAEKGKHSSTLDLSDMLIEAAREMDSDWLDFWPVESIKKIAKEALFGFLVLLGVGWFAWVCLFQAFLT